MLQADDLIHIPYTPDLTEGGITYACRSLNRPQSHGAGSSLDHLRGTAARVAVELALRRYLDQQGIPYRVLTSMPFTEPEHREVSLGGHRCSLETTFISNRRHISLLRADPASMVRSNALIPVDQFSDDSHKPEDILLFAFLLGLVAASREADARVISAGQPACYLHLLPEAWAYPRAWIPLEHLALKSEWETPLTVHIGGMDAQRKGITSTLELPPLTRILVEDSYYALTYVHVKEKPAARLGIHSPARGDPHIIHPHDWGNLWVYGMDIWVAGWTTHEEFRRNARVHSTDPLNGGMLPSHTKDLALPIRELKPCGPLFRRVKSWAVEKAGSPAP